LGIERQADGLADTERQPVRGLREPLPPDTPPSAPARDERTAVIDGMAVLLRTPRVNGII
jgi:hypothetical protein